MLLREARPYGSVRDLGIILDCRSPTHAARTYLHASVRAELLLVTRRPRPPPAVVACQVVAQPAVRTCAVARNRET